MSANFLWGAVGTVVHIATTGTGELNSLANATLSAATAAINNSGNYQSGRFALLLASAAFVAPSIISIYATPSMDGTNGTFPTLTSFAAAALSNYLVAAMYINGSTAAQNEVLDGCFMPPGYSKFYFATTGSCPTLAGSGNACDFLPTPTSY